MHRIEYANLTPKGSVHEGEIPSAVPPLSHCNAERLLDCEWPTIQDWMIKNPKPESFRNSESTAAHTLQNTEGNAEFVQDVTWRPFALSI